MKFEEALVAMREGKVIKRNGWSDESQGLCLFESIGGAVKIIQMVRRGSDYSTWHPRQEDIVAEDYSLMESE